MTLFTAVLPLRLSSHRIDLAQMLAAYLDANPSIGVRSMDCLEDLQRMGKLRSSILRQIYEKDGYDQGLECREDMHEYYNLLLECEARGIVGQSSGSQASGQEPLVLEWESAITGQIQVDGTLEWERANIVWNLATLDIFQASKQKLDTKMGWSKAAQFFQTAASWLQHIPPSAAHTVDFSDTFLQFWQTLLIAQSQRCIYESLACANRPKHLLLAKLAAAAVPLFGEMENILGKDEESGANILRYASQMTNNWADYCQAWGMYMSCKAEHHQALNSKDKKQWGQELARLDLAHEFAYLCNEYCERAPLYSLQQLHQTVEATVHELRERLEQARQEIQAHQQPVPQRSELTEIRGEKLVNIDQPLEKLLIPMQGEPMFQNVVDTQHLRGYIDMFHDNMGNLLDELSGAAFDRTESARKALATVNLPHSLTAYRQEQAGGGIPEDLWQRVQGIQRERRIAKLKQDLWELRDVAEVARLTFQKIQSQLDFDLESDDLFRKENPTFEGHDAHEVQKSFRQSLGSYDRLLVTAQEGDSVLLRRLEILDTNPKYKLLQFQKTQLDRLLPGAEKNGAPPIDTSYLSRLLVDLSAMFHDRESLLNNLRDDIRSYDIQGVLQSQSGTGSDQECRDALACTENAFDSIVFEIRSNLERQTELLDAILSENEQFMMFRERNGNSQSADSCIVMIEDALEEIEQLSKNLKEGRDFYDVVNPKLEKLKQQVGDVSARLTVERLEFDDKASRNRQEEEDALMAERMNNSNADGPPPGQPGMTQVSHGEPRVFVDDEKVATLVAMDFDPAKVVAALTKHNNDVDQALNDLLSC